MLLVQISSIFCPFLELLLHLVIFLIIISFIDNDFSCIFLTRSLVINYSSSLVFIVFHIVKNLINELVINRKVLGPIIITGICRLILEIVSGLSIYRLCLSIMIFSILFHSNWLIICLLSSFLTIFILFSYLLRISPMICSFLLHFRGDA